MFKNIAEMIIVTKWPTTMIKITLQMYKKSTFRVHSVAYLLLRKFKFYFAQTIIAMIHSAEHNIQIVTPKVKATGWGQKFCSYLYDFMKDFKWHIITTISCFLKVSNYKLVSTAEGDLSVILCKLYLQSSKLQTQLNNLYS